MPFIFALPLRYEPVFPIIDKRKLIRALHLFLKQWKFEYERKQIKIAVESDGSTTCFPR